MSNVNVYEQRPGNIQGESPLHHAGLDELAGHLAHRRTRLDGEIQRAGSQPQRPVGVPGQRPRDTGGHGQQGGQQAEQY